MVEATGRYVVPGFIDAHMHLESVKLLVDEFARLVLPLGTTAVVADPHEIANVLGSDGSTGCTMPRPTSSSSLFHGAVLRARVPLRVAAPAARPGDLEALMRRNRVLGLAEMMNFPGVIAGVPPSSRSSLSRAPTQPRPSPGVLGKGLQAYAAAGIRSDHETSPSRRGANGCRPGCGSDPRGVDGAEPAGAAPTRRRVRPGQDRVLHGRPRPRGHRGERPLTAWCARRSRRESTEHAILMASFHPAQWHRLYDLGARSGRAIRRTCSSCRTSSGSSPISS